jgi:hypothetical protein
VEAGAVSAVLPRPEIARAIERAVRDMSVH